MKSGVTLQLFVYRHPSNIRNKPGAYRQGDIVCAYQGIPENLSELKGLVGKECAIHPRFKFVGIENELMNGQFVQDLLKPRVEIEGIDGDGVAETRVVLVRNKKFDYLNAQAALRSSIINNKNVQIVTKTQFKGLLKEHS